MHLSINKFLSIFTLAAVTFAAATSCGEGEEDDFILSPGGGSSTSGNGGSSGTGGGNTSGAGSGVMTRQDYLRKIEVPKLIDETLFVQHSVEWKGDSVMNYCLEFDPIARHSRWVAFRFDAVTRQSNVGRSSEPFMDDPDIPSRYEIGYNGFGSEYYDLNGKLQKLPTRQFDRGHICASADRYLSREANEQTFYMTNMSPQMSNFNSPYWSSFEQFVQKRGRDVSFADTLYVVKGGTILPGQILGHVERRNGSMVTIPKYYFMALLKCKNNTYSSIAFWMEHKDYGIDDGLKNREMAEKAISIDELEELTGIDFFHNLPDAVENAVEATCQPSAWSL